MAPRSPQVCYLPLFYRGQILEPASLAALPATAAVAVEAHTVLPRAFRVSGVERRPLRSLAAPASALPPAQEAMPAAPPPSSRNPITLSLLADNAD